MSGKHFNRKLKKGDEVQIMTGRDNGQRGKIELVDTKHDAVYITGLNLYKKHLKPTQERPEATIDNKAMRMHISNVMLVDPTTSKPTRVRYSVNDGQKTRIAVKSSTSLAVS